MSLEDRDWWREDRKKKEELYCGDFSLNSKPKESIPKNGFTEDDVSVLNKPISLVNVIVFVLIFGIGIFLFHINAIIVTIVASIGAVLPEIMKIKKSNRVKAGIKTIIYAVLIILGTMALFLIYTLLMGNYR